MNALSYVLATGAVALPAAWVTALASLALLPLVRRLSPVARGEASAWIGLLPALVAAALIAAISVPSVLYGLGLGSDHCFGHAHHPHVCFWHGAALPAWLAVVGSGGWAWLVFGFARTISRLVHTERRGRRLAALGRPDAGFRVVPSSLAVCHVVGVVRPTVILSRAVRDRLDPRELRAVVAHEHAHVARADTRWSAILALAGCIAPTGAWQALWRDAAEEAADDVAASVTDGPTVASALVAVARMGLDPTPGLGFGAGRLERRVLRMLGAPGRPRSSCVTAGAVLMALSALAVVAGAHERLHHAVEEGWEQVSGRRTG